MSDEKTYPYLDAVIERMQSLIDYTKSTSVKTTFTQSRILKKYNCDEQAHIIAHLEIGPPALYGRDGGAK